MCLQQVGWSGARLRSALVVFGLVFAACGSGSGKATDAGSRTDDAGDTSVDPDPVCGNGRIEPGELCDDSNTDDGDRCSANCQKTYGGPDCSTLGTCPELCGNAQFDASEACDDGNETDGDGCDTSCQVESGWGCARPGSACVRLPVCGNSVRERGEECDSGPTSDTGCAECKVQSGF